MGHWTLAQYVLAGLGWLFAAAVFVFGYFVIRGVPGNIRSISDEDREDDDDSPFDYAMLPTVAEYNAQLNAHVILSNDRHHEFTSGYLTLPLRSLSEVNALRRRKLIQVVS